jgi:hypothetical protein
MLEIIKPIVKINITVLHIENITLNPEGVSTGSPIPTVTSPINLVNVTPVPNSPPVSISALVIEESFKFTGLEYPESIEPPRIKNKLITA